MINPLNEMAFTSQTASRVDTYTDNGKQSVISTGDAIAEAIFKRSETAQTDIDTARQSLDTVEISDEARQRLQNAVSNRDTPAGKHGAESGNDQDSLLTRSADNDSATSEAQERMNALRKQLQQAQKELRKAQQALSAAQGKVSRAQTEQEQLNAETEIMAAQQRVNGAQQRVQAIMNQLLESQSSTV